MELQRGICILCLDHNNKVYSPKDAKEYVEIIPQVLDDAVMDFKEFKKIQNQIKVCSVCCFKLTIVTSMKKEIDQGRTQADGNNKNFCFFCKIDRKLIAVDCQWKYFIDRTEGVFDIKKLKNVCVCPHCLFYLDAVHSVRTKLFLKYPQLRIPSSTPQLSSSVRRPGTTPVQKSTPTPKKQSTKNHKRTPNVSTKRKASSISPLTPETSKRRKISHNCFDRLTPLAKTTLYRVNDEALDDKKLFEEIAYVDLSQYARHADKPVHPAHHSDNKDRPKIKIKLIKPKHKRDRVVIISHSKNEDKSSDEQDSLNKYGIKKRAYVDLSSDAAVAKLHKKSNSENVNQSTNRKERHRRRSDRLEKKEETSEDKEQLEQQNVEETPKTHVSSEGSSNNVPKVRRRGSLFAENNVDEEERDRKNDETVLESEGGKNDEDPLSINAEDAGQEHEKEKEEENGNSLRKSTEDKEAEEDEEKDDVKLDSTSEAGSDAATEGDGVRNEAPDSMASKNADDSKNTPASSPTKEGGKPEENGITEEVSAVVSPTDPLENSTVVLNGKDTEQASTPEEKSDGKSLADQDDSENIEKDNVENENLENENLENENIEERNRQEGNEEDTPASENTEEPKPPEDSDDEPAGDSDNEKSNKDSDDEREEDKEPATSEKSPPDEDLGSSKVNVDANLEGVTDVSPAAAAAAAHQSENSNSTNESDKDSGGSSETERKKKRVTFSDDIQL